MVEFIINNAWAQSATPQGGGGSFLFMMIIFFVIFYFLLIRPQSKQAKEQREMLESLTKGDEVVTSGGILGRINKIGDSFLVLEVAKDLDIKVQKSAISAVMPKGTIKTI